MFYIAYMMFCGFFSFVEIAKKQTLSDENATFSFLIKNIILHFEFQKRSKFHEEKEIINAGVPLCVDAVECSAEA